MRLSIITICYNDCVGLKRTIDSVLKQSVRSEFEYIIIDGNSTDGSKELLERFNNGIDYWNSEPDKGIYNAMNKGVRVAHGDYCLFLNSGDRLLDSSVIERVFDHEWRADIISCDQMTNGNIFHNYQKSPDKISYMYMVKHHIFHPSTFIKTELLRTHPYDEQYRIISDWAFFFDMLAVEQKTYQRIPEPLSVFYLDGISSTSNSQNSDERYKFLCTKLPQPLVDDLLKTAPFGKYLLYINWLEKSSVKIIDACLYFVRQFDYRVVKSIQSLVFNFKCRNIISNK